MEPLNRRTGPVTPESGAARPSRRRRPHPARGARRLAGAASAVSLVALTGAVGHRCVPGRDGHESGNRQDRDRHDDLVGDHRGVHHGNHGGHPLHHHDGGGRHPVHHRGHRHEQGQLALGDLPHQRLGGDGAVALVDPVAEDVHGRSVRGVKRALTQPARPRP